MKNLSDCHVLIIDDSVESMMILECLLENLCHIHTSDQGTDALALVEKLRPDLILLDVVMPGADGFSICKALKSSPVTTHIPVIFLTGLSDSRDKVSGFAAGGVDYVTKPFDGAEIRARVKNHLRLSLYEQEQRRHIEYLSGAVRDTEETYLFFANHTTDVLMQCSPDGTIRRINRSWAELTGHDDPVGKLFWDVVCREDSDLLRESLLQGIQERKDDLHLTFRIPAKKGGDRTIRGAFRICYNHSGHPVGLNGVLTDISELALERESLENVLVSGRATAAAHLSYLENISHEIRTPLNLLQGGLQQLRENEAGLRTQEALNLIEQGTVGLADLMNAILEKDGRNAMASSGIFHTAASPHPVGGTPVLIVDDIKSNRQILAHIMKSLGFQECDLAGSGEEALESWRKRQHPLVLLDYQMDGLDGYETCRRIRNSPSAIRPTILGVSASALAENMGRALEAGFCAQIPKPVSKPLIKQTLESLGWQFAQ